MTMTVLMQLVLLARGLEV